MTRFFIQTTVLITIVFLCTTAKSAFGQDTKKGKAPCETETSSRWTKVDDKKIDSLIKKIQPWYDGGGYGWHAPSFDSTMTALIEIGRRAGKQLYSLLDSTDKVVPAHILLTLIYDCKYGCGTETISKTNTYLKVKKTSNSLVWTTEIYQKEDSSWTTAHTLDKVSQGQIKEMWKKRIGL